MPCHIGLIDAQGGRQEARQGRDAVWHERQSQQRRIFLVLHGSLALSPLCVRGRLRFLFAHMHVSQRCAGDKYDGEWVHHQRHGQCTYTWASGEVPMTVVIRCRVPSSKLRRL